MWIIYYVALEPRPAYGRHPTRPVQIRLIHRLSAEVILRSLNPYALWIYGWKLLLLGARVCEGSSDSRKSSGTDRIN